MTETKQKTPEKDKERPGPNENDTMIMCAGLLVAVAGSMATDSSLVASFWTAASMISASNLVFYNQNKRGFGTPMQFRIAASVGTGIVLGGLAFFAHKGLTFLYEEKVKIDERTQALEPFGVILDNHCPAEQKEISATVDGKTYTIPCP